MASLDLPKHADTVFQRWHMSLSPEDKVAYADRLGISQNMVRANYLIPLLRPLLSMKLYKKRTRGNPNQEVMHKLAKATQGACSYTDMLDHFYPRSVPE